MSAAHTPGPWEVSHGTRVYNAAGVMVVDHGDVPRWEALANARLIAVAPELLALVDRLARAGSPMPDKIAAEFIDQARALIVKAES